MTVNSTKCWSENSHPILQSGNPATTGVNHRPPSIKAMDLTSCFRRSISAVCGSRLMTGLFLIFRALSAYRNVLRVSSMLMSAGLAQAIITVWLFPPRESTMIRRGTDPLWHLYIYYYHMYPILKLISH